MPPLPPSPPPYPPTFEMDLHQKVIVEPIVPTVTAVKPSSRTQKPTTSTKKFSIASLQPYIDSFSPDNLIGACMLGSFYMAQLPDGKVWSFC